MRVAQSVPGDAGALRLADQRAVEIQARFLAEIRVRQGLHRGGAARALPCNTTVRLNGGYACALSFDMHAHGKTPHINAMTRGKSSVSIVLKIKSADVPLR